MHCISWVCWIWARELTPIWCLCMLRGIEWGVYIRAALAGITACSAGTFKQDRLPQGQNLYRLCMYANLSTPQKLQHSCTPLLQIETPQAVRLLKQQLGSLPQGKGDNCCTLLSR